VDGEKDPLHIPEFRLEWALIHLDSIPERCENDFLALIGHFQLVWRKYDFATMHMIKVYFFFAIESLDEIDLCDLPLQAIPVGRVQSLYKNP
jgi:hypothetical protein